jgi:tRNA 2-thiouridine synthesizing protein D
METTENKPRLTFALMDAPFESARTAIAFRLLEAALRRGFAVTTFCYEGAVGHAFAKQTAHPNATHGRDAIQEDHPLPKDWVSALMKLGPVQWINCGMCVDERGLNEAIPGVVRGSPADLWKNATQSVNTLIIATR